MFPFSPFGCNECDLCTDEAMMVPLVTTSAALVGEGFPPAIHGGHLPSKDDLWAQR